MTGGALIDVSIVYPLSLHMGAFVAQPRRFRSGSGQLGTAVSGCFRQIRNEERPLRRL
jgi:hypothetical protein